MSLQTPILFCVFNRPDLTARVFRSIARQRPKRLLIACDGPRKSQPADRSLVQQTRDICQQIDWPCDVSTFFRHRNHGCRKHMAAAITWAFDLCEQLIILEDDCLPDLSFFSFCESLLDRFANDPRVMMVSGDNFQPATRGPGSYYFSKYSHIWGWASWRRAWQHYDLQMKSWPAARDNQMLRQFSCDENEQQYWTDIFDRQHAGQIETWDYSWAYACWEHRGLTVLPQTNLVSNIGFRADATHTTDAEHLLASRPTIAIDQLVHPSVVARDAAADVYSWRNVFCPVAWREASYSMNRNWLEKLSRRRAA